MKIGILSLVLHTNYGGLLQSYALQTVLERMGHKVVVLTRDRDIHVRFINVAIIWCKFFVKKYILREELPFYNPYKLNAERHEREKNTRRFIEEYIHTRVVRVLKNGVFDDMDAVIVGSDQVWRPIYFQKQWLTNIEDAFLKFQDNSDLKRIAYAVSFGTDEWEYSEQETKECSKLLKMFDAVSVRELSGIELCKEKLSYDNAKLVLDPTLLLDRDDYIRLIHQANTEPSPGNMMCYVLDRTEETNRLIEKISKDRNLVPFYANSKIEDKNAPQKERIQPPVEQWLRGFLDAEFVVTDSFHACVFSIIFGKPFVVVGNAKRGMTRFQSFLSMFSLRNHLILNSSEYDSEYDYSIEEIVYKKYQENKRISMNFLQNTLSTKN